MVGEKWKDPRISAKSILLNFLKEPVSRGDQYLWCTLHTNTSTDCRYYAQNPHFPSTNELFSPTECSTVFWPWRGTEPISELLFCDIFIGFTVYFFHRYSAFLLQVHWSFYSDPERPSLSAPFHGVSSDLKTDCCLSCSLEWSESKTKVAAKGMGWYDSIVTALA